jgi:hypothetical protein
VEFPGDPAVLGDIDYPEAFMKKKRVLEADLDPRDTPRTRPGGETAKRALALAKGRSSGRKKRVKTRPGAYAVERALADIKRHRESEK